MNCFACQAQLREGDRFCHNCGSPTRALSDAPAQIRLLTVVAFRLIDYHQMLSSRRELRSHRTLGSLLARVDATFEQAGAILLDRSDVDPDMGYAVLGATRAGLDTAELALRAAVTARNLAREASGDAWQHTGAPLQLSVGIDSGKALVQVGPDETPLSVRGVPMIVAARLQAAAGADGILVDESTRRAVGDKFALEPAEPVAFRDEGVSIPTYRLEMRASRSRHSSRGLLTGRFQRPMVGRERELARIRDAATEVVEMGRCRLAVVRGANGTGRSRLLREAVQLLRSEHAKLHVAEASVPRRGAASTPFGLSGRIVASLSRFDVARPEQAGEALRRWLEETYSDTLLPELEASWLMHLAGVGEVPEVVGGDTELAGEVSYRAVVDLIRQLGQSAPVVLAIDDVSRALPREIALLRRLVADLERSPVLVVVTDGASGAPQLGEPHVAVELGPLPDEAARVLVDQVLGRRDALPAAVASEIVAHAGAIPLVIEETLSALTEAGLLSVDPVTGAWSLQDDKVPAGLPNTLEGLVAARLDQMPEGPGDVLRKAAVAGEVFWRGLIEELGEAQAAMNLDQLEELGLVVKSYRHSLEGNVGYRFAHGVTRDVAYSEVPREQAQAHHARVARWLAVNTGDRFNDWLGAIAWHFGRAGDATRAVSYHMQAGQWARSRGDVGEAAFQFERARELAPSEDVAMEAAVELADAQLMTGQLEVARELLGEILTWSEGRPDVRHTIRVLALLARVNNQLDHPDAAETPARRGLEMARQIGATRDMGTFALEMARVNLARGHEAAALDAANDAVAWLTEVGDRPALLRASLESARPLLHLGQLTKAEVAFEEAGKFARELNHWLLYQRAQHGLAWVALVRGDHESAAGAFRSCRELFARVGAHRLQAASAIGQALASAEIQAYADAANTAAEALEVCQRAHADAMEALAHAVVGYIYGQVELEGHRLKAKELTPEALKAARTSRSAHLEAALEGLGESSPRLYRVLASLFQAEYLLRKNPGDAAGLEAARQTRVLLADFEPCALVERALALTGS